MVQTTGHVAWRALRNDRQSQDPSRWHAERLSACVWTVRRPAIDCERVLIPGDIEREREVQIRRDGINVIEPVQKDMKEIAGALGIDFDYQG